MSIQTIDLTKYVDRFGARVPEGTYLAEVATIDVGLTRKGDPMWTVGLSIIGGDSEGATIVDRLTLSERAMFRMVGFLRGLGIKTPRKRFQVNTETLIGRRVELVVVDGEPYNGNIRSEVSSYNPVPGGAVRETADLDDLADTEEAEAEVTVEELPAPAPTPAPEADVAEMDMEDELSLDDLEV